jgi:hypothetical protein
MTVREMLSRIDSRELSEWLAYYGLNPWGPERADLRAGTIASTVANCMSDKGNYKPSDFMPRYGPKPEEPPKSSENLKNIAIRMNAMMGGTFAKK